MAVRMDILIVVLVTKSLFVCQSIDEHPFYRGFPYTSVSTSAFTIREGLAGTVENRRFPRVSACRACPKCGPAVHACVHITLHNSGGYSRYSREHGLQKVPESECV